MSLGPLLLVPVIVLLTVPALAREAKREKDPILFRILLLALFVKLAGAVARHYVAFDIYEGNADAARYHEFGLDLAPGFWSSFDIGAIPHGTDFIRYFTGMVYSVLGTSQVGGFLFFSWLGFWGLFFFYKAFVAAVPEGRRRSYAILVFFLPSLVFWPSSIGKEAWMMFTLGLGAFGASYMLTGRLVKGVLVGGSGLWLASLVRPHIAGLMVLGIVAAYVIRRPRAELGTIGPIMKLVALVALVGVAFVMVGRAEEFLQAQGVETGGGVGGTLGSTSDRTSKGGSEFTPSILDSPARAPLAVVTVLYRPLIFEAGNTQQLAAGAEATFLLILTLVRIKWVWAAFRSLRRQPYVAFAFAYSGLMILALSSFSNLGLLARERVQLFPLFMVLLCVPPREKAAAAKQPPARGYRIERPPNLPPVQPERALAPPKETQ